MCCFHDICNRFNVMCLSHSSLICWFSFPPFRSYHFGTPPLCDILIMFYQNEEKFIIIKYVSLFVLSRQNLFREPWYMHIYQQSRGGQIRKLWASLCDLGKITCLQTSTAARAVCLTKLMSSVATFGIWVLHWPSLLFHMLLNMRVLTLKY